MEKSQLILIEELTRRIKRLEATVKRLTELVLSAGIVKEEEI